MAILKIARMGHPVLKQRAEEISDPTDPKYHRLVADMLETLVDSGGVGLAAPQVHVSERLVLLHVPAARMADERYQDAGLDEETGEVPLTVLINPVIEPLSDETEEAYEGCLSLPGMMGAVPRYTHIRYSGIGLDGEPFAREAKGFHARVVQHECDHLDGVLYPQRIEDMRKFGFNEEMKLRMKGQIEMEEAEA